MAFDSVFDLFPELSDDNGQKSFVRILGDIYDLTQEEADVSFPERSPDVCRLKETYELNSEAVVVLAVLMHAFPDPVPALKIRSALAGMDTSTLAVCANLLERGFLRSVGTSGTVNLQFGLTVEAYEAICAEQPFGERAMEDCLEELRTCALSDMVSEHWLARFNKALSQPANAALNEAVAQLGIRDYSDDVQTAFWVVARQFAHSFLEPLTLSIGQDEFDALPLSRALLSDGLAVLVKEGLVIRLPIEPMEETKDADRYLLAPRVAGLLFRGREELIRYDEVTRYADVLKARDIVERPLYFAPETQQEADQLCKMLSRDGFARACGILRRQKRNPAIQSLLWGPPGTGKTELVKQIARRTGRDIILLDVSKVTESAWGASEKLFRAVFRAYNYIAEISPATPIFLLNEADSLLSRRLTLLERAIDKGENTISNILLQAFEDMSGILLATTNLIDNLDEAFDRRFLFKTEMRKPDANARFRIWKSDIPSLSDADARTLALEFEMSGAQISNVAVKWNLAELYYEGDRGLDYLESLCRKELATERGSSFNRTRIGF